VKFLIVSSQLTPYLWECARQLTTLDGCAARIVSIGEPTVQGFELAQFESQSPALQVSWKKELADRQECFESWKPDRVLVGGWFLPELRWTLDQCLTRRIPCLCMSDTPLDTSLWTTIANLVKRAYLRRRCDALMVPGERAALNGEALGFERTRQVRPLYCVDLASYGEKKNDDGTRSFLFGGRWSPEKNIPRLLKAYAAYRQRVDHPWELRLAGHISADDAREVTGLAGVRHLGMLQPQAFRQALASATVFVLPSVSDAWGVALLEAAATGLPLAASWACGGTVELLVDRLNGVSFDPHSVDRIADALLQMHASEDALAAMGRHSRTRASGFDTGQWASAVYEWGLHA
jgi:glycosyltransferase involved in cell wall biosynthesis